VDKPRKGAFVLTATKEGEADGKTFLNLLDMPRPFTKLKAIDFSALASELVDYFK
jgi:hypothetical protein